MTEGVLCILCPPATPVVLVMVAIGPQVSPDLLDLAFNLAVATRMHVCDSEGGKSVAKSMPIWDNGQFGMGKGTSLPAGRCRGVCEMAQTEKVLTYRETSCVISGHQYLLRRSERVSRAREVWTESMRDRRRADGTYTHPSGTPGGVGSVCEASAI